MGKAAIFERGRNGENGQDKRSGQQPIRFGYPGQSFRQTTSGLLALVGALVGLREYRCLCDRGGRRVDGSPEMGERIAYRGGKSVRFSTERDGFFWRKRRRLW